ncbi:hypothetical protein GALL_313590 [mine drainage metagenome]|uniref:Uncharacterized protein n=1 Tax=mine drainage metagenome TaxID=410659 RepID=A0A1J5QTV7_9ZZZZ
MREQLGPDQHAADLAGAGTDLVQLGVAPQPAERIFVDVTVAAEDLDAFSGHPGRLLGAPQNHRGAILAHFARMTVTARIEVAPHRVQQAARGLQHRVHVGKLGLDQLELADRLAELLALVDVGHDFVHHRLHDAHRPGGEHRALVVEPAHQHAHAAADFAQHVGRRHFAVLEHQLAGVAAAHAELVEFLRDAEALEALLDDEGGDAFRAGGRIGLRVDDHGVGVGAVGDPHLAAVEHPDVAAALGAQLHADDVGAGARLAHRQRADVLAAEQLGQVACLQLGAAVAPDLVHAQVRVRAVAQRHGSAGARDLLHRDHVRQIAHAGAAVGLGHRDAQQSEVAELAPQVHRELVVAVDLGRARRDLGDGEVAHRVAHRVDVGAELEIKSGEVHGHGLAKGRRQTVAGVGSS